MKNPNIWLQNCLHAFRTEVELRMPGKGLQNYTDKGEPFSTEPPCAKANAKGTQTPCNNLQGHQQGK